MSVFLDGMGDHSYETKLYINCNYEEENFRWHAARRATWSKSVLRHCGWQKRRHAIGGRKGVAGRGGASVMTDKKKREGERKIQSGRQSTAAPP